MGADVHYSSSPNVRGSEKSDDADDVPFSISLSVSKESAAGAAGDNRRKMERKEMRSIFPVNQGIQLTGMIERLTQKEETESAYSSVPSPGKGKSSSAEAASASSKTAKAGSERAGKIKGNNRSMTASILHLRLFLPPFIGVQRLAILNEAKGDQDAASRNRSEGTSSPGLKIQLLPNSSAVKLTDPVKPSIDLPVKSCLSPFPLSRFLSFPSPIRFLDQENENRHSIIDFFLLPL